MTGKRGPISGDKRSVSSGGTRGAPGQGKKNLPSVDPFGDNLPLEVPPYPKGLKLQQTKEVWDDFWRSPVARAINWESDQTALSRWALLSDRWFRIIDQLEREGPTQTGTRGTDVLSPLSQEQARLATQIKDLEQQLGLTPMARARLGLTAASGELVAAQLNEMVRGAQSIEENVVDIDGWE